MFKRLGLIVVMLLVLVPVVSATPGDEYEFDNPAAVLVGTWASPNDANAVGGSLRRSETPGDTATWSVTIPNATYDIFMSTRGGGGTNSNDYSYTIDGINYDLVVSGGVTQYYLLAEDVVLGGAAFDVVMTIPDTDRYHFDAVKFVEVVPVGTPTNTPIPPTDTPIPPTDTPAPPTNTPPPGSTDTPTPLPTDTPIPPTDTPVPGATSTPTPVVVAPSGPPTTLAAFGNNPSHYLAVFYAWMIVFVLFSFAAGDHLRFAMRTFPWFTIVSALLVANYIQYMFTLFVLWLFFEVIWSVFRFFEVLGGVK